MKIPVEFNALGALPDGWSWQPLQSLTANPKQDVVDGPFGSNLKASEYVSAGVPIARIQNIDRNTFVTKNIRFLTPAKAAELARHEFKQDDILITKLGDPLGKACIVPASIGRGVIVADLVRVRSDEKLVDRKYLTYAINSPTLVKQFELHTKGTTRPRVNLSVLRQLPIPLAPREIQTEICRRNRKAVLPPRRSRRQPPTSQGQPQTLQSLRPQRRRRRPPRPHRSRTSPSRRPQL